VISATFNQSEHLLHFVYFIVHNLDLIG